MTKARTKAKKSEEELPFKVSDHFLVPKHELMTTEQATELLKRYNASASEFPFVLSTDPPVKAIGAKAGDFVKITRKSETAGESTYYRYVVEA